MVGAMDRAQLESYLEQGLSLDRIGKLVGKHPSTVGYWLKKHGLQANGRVRHAPKGGIEPERLRVLAERGLSVAQIAVGLGRGRTTVRYWLRRYRIAPARSERAMLAKTARDAGLVRARLTCARHGETEFILSRHGRNRCARCSLEAVARRRRKAKAILVDEAGGCCAICGYDRYQGALQFHHLDPCEKQFELSVSGMTPGIDRLRKEARKCVLLCSDCHAEVEAGISEIPAYCAS
jgi:DNA-binding transcriptional ArsR family regulator